MTNTENITLLNLDLLNSDNVDKLIKQYSPNTVYNLSGPSSVYESLKNPFIEEQIKIIFNNLTNILISSNNFCNFFQASSSEMFGNTNTEILNENTDFSPNSPYALAKLNNHNLVKEYSSKYNWNIFSGIMFNHESRFRHENYLIMKIITTALQISSGKIPESWLYDKFNSSRLVKLPISGGIEPVSWLFHKFKRVKLVRFPISDGMEK